MLIGEDDIKDYVNIHRDLFIRLKGVLDDGVTIVCWIDDQVNTNDDQFALVEIKKDKGRNIAVVDMNERHDVIAGKERSFIEMINKIIEKEGLDFDPIKDVFVTGILKTS